MKIENMQRSSSNRNQLYTLKLDWYYLSRQTQFMTKKATRLLRVAFLVTTVKRFSLVLDLQNQDF